MRFQIKGILLVILRNKTQPNMAKKNKLFLTIFITISILCFFSLWTASAIDEDMVESKVVIVLGTFIFYIFRFPLLFIESIFHLDIFTNYWFFFALLFDTLFYTIIIYFIYLWNKNRRKEKEE